MPYFAEFLINSVSIRHRFAYDAGRSRDPRIRVIPLRRPGPEERLCESRKYPSSLPPPCWTASAEHAKDYATIVRLRSRGDLIRSAVPQHHPPRSVQFRTEIGPVPRRDRFSSASRSVHFRLEIGRVPRRDRSGSGSRSVQAGGRGRCSPPATETHAPAGTRLGHDGAREATGPLSRTTDEPDRGN